MALALLGAPDMGQRGPKIRRYEVFWEWDVELLEVIKEAWNSVGSVDNLDKIQTALRKTLATLSSWGNKKFGNISRELAKSHTQLEELMSMNADRQDIRNVTDKMNELIYQEEMMWLQRSRITWLKEGDANTKFFQAFANGRRAKNFIPLIKHGDQVITNPDRME